MDAQLRIHVETCIAGFDKKSLQRMDAQLRIHVETSKAGFYK